MQVQVQMSIPDCRNPGTVGSIDEHVVARKRWTSQVSDQPSEPTDHFTIT